MIEAFVPRPSVNGQIKNDTAVRQNDAVSHPSHYTYGSIECIDFIEDKELNFNRGNAIKYIVRAGHKENELQDLQKAKWYIEREISRIEKGSST